MEWWHAVILGIVEGLTEFLPVSSTGHLTIVEKFLGYEIDAPGITAFTAVIQIGAILAAVIYFWPDIWRVAQAWVQGFFQPKKKRSPDYAFGWAVIIGSVPIAIVGLIFKDQIETVLRSLWVVAGTLIAWSVVMWYADRRVTAKPRTEASVTWRDTLMIGMMQCFALIPGVSRSGATISAGLLRGFDRTTATRMSFFLGIPALVAAGGLEAVTQAKNISHSVGWGAAIIGIIVSFIVGYLSIAWLLKFVSKHSFTAFIWYRVVAGIVLIILLVTGTVTAV